MSFLKKTNFKKEEKETKYTIVKDLENIKIDSDVSINIDLDNDKTEKMNEKRVFFSFYF